MNEHHFPLIAVISLVVIALGYWFLSTPEKPQVVPQKIETVPVEKVRTRVEATMTNCAQLVMVASTRVRTFSTGTVSIF